MEKFRMFFLLFTVSFLLFSCTKSGALTGSGSPSSSGSFSGSLTGSVNGGLSPTAGSLINLYVLGNPTPVASATTTSSGAFSLNYAAPGGGNLLYVQATGGSAGHGANGNLQLFALLGSASSIPSSVILNELTTTAFLNVMSFYGLMTDSNGVISFTATPSPNNSANSAAQTSALAQYNNFVTNGAVNTSLSSGNQTIVNTTGNAIAGCVENSANCAALFAAAQSSTGGAAKSISDAVMNFINLSNNVSPIYTLGSSNAASTGFSQGGMPAGFSFSLPPVVTSTTITVSGTCRGVAVDGSGNVWIGNVGSNQLTKLSPSGAILGTFSTNSQPWYIAIDAAGNIWVTEKGNSSVSEYNSSGTKLATFTVLADPTTPTIDQTGNVWIGYQNAGFLVTKSSSSGSSLGNFTVSNRNPEAITIDVSGNAWVSVTGENIINELSPSGNLLRTISPLGGGPIWSAFDPSGNLWVGNFGATGTVSELSPSGAMLGTFTPTSGDAYNVSIDPAGGIWISDYINSKLEKLNSSGNTLAVYSSNLNDPDGLAIDASGNIWAANLNVATVVKFSGIALGPQFFPYSGPIWP